MRVMSRFVLVLELSAQIKVSGGGAATVSASTLTFADTMLSKPGDTCTWSFTIRNTGSIAAKISGFAYTKPVSSCTTRWIATRHALQRRLTAST